MPLLEQFEKDLINELSKLFGGDDVIIKIRRRDSDRNEFKGTGKEAARYLKEKNGL